MGWFVWDVWFEDDVVDGVFLGGGWLCVVEG